MYDNLFRLIKRQFSLIKWLLVCSLIKTCADPESFVRAGPTLTFFLFVFLVDEGGEEPNTTISGPSSARQRNAIKWRFAGGPLMSNIECWLRWRADDAQH